MPLAVFASESRQATLRDVREAAAVELDLDLTDEDAHCISTGRGQRCGRWQESGDRVDTALPTWLDRDCIS